jgi:DNA-directed RNA polymerase subunit RPC12/RpoP
MIEVHCQQQDNLYFPSENKVNKCPNCYSRLLIHDIFTDYVKCGRCKRTLQKKLERDVTVEVDIHKHQCIVS